MPKLAATLASFLLIASSIGVNIARYPQVGRTMDAAAAGAAETASPLQNAGDIPHVEKADADQSPVGQEKAPPAVTEKRPGAAHGEPPADRMAAAAPQQTAASIEKDVPIVDVRPMVSVGETQTNGMEPPPNASRFQRLPPVESSGQVPFAGGVVDDGMNYPTTATP